MNRAEELAVLLEENARHDEDLEAARLLRKLYVILEVEMIGKKVLSRTVF